MGSGIIVTCFYEPNIIKYFLSLQKCHTYICEPRSVQFCPPNTGNVSSIRSNDLCVCSSRFFLCLSCPAQVEASATCRPFRGRMYARALAVFMLSCPGRGLSNWPISRPRSLEIKFRSPNKGIPWTS
jgi:hypothetical protein